VLLHYLAKHGRKKIARFHSNVVIAVYQELNQSLFDFFNFVAFN